MDQAFSLEMLETGLNSAHFPRFSGSELDRQRQVAPGGNLSAPPAGPTEGGSALGEPEDTKGWLYPSPSSSFANEEMEAHKHFAQDCTANRWLLEGSNTGHSVPRGLLSVTILQSCSQVGQPECCVTLRKGLDLSVLISVKGMSGHSNLGIVVRIQ